MTYEIELKLRFEPQQADLLCDALDRLAGSSQQFTLNNSYYDTPDARLSRAACALRIRQKGDAFEQTLKTRGDNQGGLTRRREWNWPLPSGSLDLQLLASEEVQLCWPADVAVKDLIPLFATNFERRRWLWQDGDNKVELVLDRGAVIADSKQQPLCELELELLSGEPACLWQLAQQLCQQLPLWISDISKAERGFALAGLGKAWLPPVVNYQATDVAALLAAIELGFENIKRALELGLWEGRSEQVDNLADAALVMLAQCQQLQSLLDPGRDALVRTCQSLVFSLLDIALTVRSASSSAVLSPELGDIGAEKLLAWGELLFDFHIQVAESAAPEFGKADESLHNSYQTGTESGDNDTLLGISMQWLAQYSQSQYALGSAVTAQTSGQQRITPLPWPQLATCVALSKQ